MRKTLGILGILLFLIMFIGCGNPAILPGGEKDDGETVTEFLEKLTEFGTGIDDVGTVKIVFKKINSTVYAHQYKKQDGVWCSVSDDVALSFTKVSNGVYKFNQNGYDESLYEWYGTYIIIRNPENPNQFFKFTKFTIPNDDGETASQFLDKLLEFGVGITDDGMRKITFTKEGAIVYARQYDKQNDVWVLIDEPVALTFTKVENNIYEFCQGRYDRALWEWHTNYIIVKNPEDPNQFYRINKLNES